jgi:glycogen synthase
MRVLHLFEHAVLGPTDAARRALALLEGLRSQGVQTVQLAAPPALAAVPAAASPAMPPGWQFYRTPAPFRLAACLPPWTHAPVAGLLLARRVREVARLTRPQLIHVHAGSGHALAAWPAARLAGLPLLVETDRRGAGPPLPWLDRLALRGADALVAASPDVRTVLRAGGIRARRIAVLPSAADLPGACVAVQGPPGLEGAPLLAYAGQLDAAGGIELLLEALALLRRTRPALRLVVAGAGAGTGSGAGTGVRLQELEQRIAALGLRGHVVFTGELTGRRLADLLPRADVAVFPAMPGAHAAAMAPPRQLLNAIAQGCTVVASDLACHAELLVHGHNGMLFRAGSRTALAGTLARLLDEPLRLRPLGRAAAETIAQRRSWPVTAARYRTLYETILHDHGRPRGVPSPRPRHRGHPGDPDANGL